MKDGRAKGETYSDNEKQAEFILKSQDNWFPGGNKGSSKRPRGAGRELWIRKCVQMAVNG